MLDYAQFSYLTRLVIAEVGRSVGYLASMPLLVLLTRELEILYSTVMNTSVGLHI